jgi:hypothetical protein
MTSLCTVVTGLTPRERFEMPPSCWIDTEIEEVYHWGQRVCFLGHQIGYGGVQPEQAKVLAIWQMA